MEEEKKQSRRTVIFNKYEMGRLLGQGNFAKVYYGRNLETHESVAIKPPSREEQLKAAAARQSNSTPNSQQPTSQATQQQCG
ncbi:hypothetical protein K1719_018270 [Acacia pycnantha]|nr:hypothetical protein K1719_018270 [Acacia pycnantha]